MKPLAGMVAVQVTHRVDFAEAQRYKGSLTGTWCSLFQIFFEPFKVDPDSAVVI